MPFESTVGTADFGFLPPNTTGDVQVFYTDNNAQGSQKWIKPRGAVMCYMICVGGGGSGGGGTSGATTTARGGGGGGACSSIAKHLIPAIFLPDVLLIQVGNGGAGVAADTNGNAGINSIISHGVGLTAIGTIPNIILQSNNAAPGGGAKGTNATGGAGGTVPTISTQAISGAAASHAIQSFIVGLVGAVGGAQTGANGANFNGSTWNLICTSPGTGGAGVNSVSTGFVGGAIGFNSGFDFADGSIVGNTALAGGTAGASGTGASGNGNAGIQLWKPFYMTGGTGGGSSDANTGGDGGKGGIGCGGGGGGGGTTGGKGGAGGDGIVIIISW